MRKSIFLVCYLFFCNNAICVSQKLTIFSGDIYGLDKGSKIYLSQSSANRIIDSFTVINDSFQFNLAIEKFDLFMFTYSVNSKISYNPVFLQKGSNVHISISSKKGPITFTGSALAEEQNEYYKGIYATSEKLTSLDDELSKTNDSNLIEKMNIKKKELIKELDDYSTLWVKNHKQSPFSIAILAFYINDTPEETLETLYENLSLQAKENNLLDQALAVSFAYKLIHEQFKIGEHIEDFVLKDTSGIPHSFLKWTENKYTLLDFWASWCGPCRRNNPEIIKLLDTYKKSNFQVVSISADTDSVQWKKAIIDDKMHWPNLSDLKGADSGFIKEHRVRSFPTYIIVAPNGEIVAIPNTIASVKEFFGNNLKEIK